MSKFTTKIRKRWLAEAPYKDSTLDYAICAVIDLCDRLDAETKKNCETERYPIGSMSAMRKEINQLEIKLNASDTEQPPTSKLTKGLRQNVREFPDFPEHLRDLFERDILKICDRLDASEASRKELVEDLLRIDNYCRVNDIDINAAIEKAE